MLPIADEIRPLPASGPQAGRGEASARVLL